MAGMLGPPVQPMIGHEISGDWASKTQSHLTKMSELRMEVRRQFNKDPLAGEAEKAPNIGGPAMEDRLKRRYRSTQDTATKVVSKMETVQHTIYQVRQVVSELSRSVTSTRAALSVVEMRLELRQQRPPNELIEDSFNEALQQEHAVLLGVIGTIVSKLEDGSKLSQPLEEVKAEMQASRLTLHLDRTGYTQQLLDRVTDLERSTVLFCKDSRRFLDETEKQEKKALAKTCACMKQKIAATMELKENIEKDMKETRRTIAEAELYLDRLEHKLHVQLAMPERQQGNAGGDLQNKKLSAQTGVLAELRAKIKAAAYTGAGGRQLGVLFGRFDKDRSGVLDEDEVRRAFRRACRITPSAVSDAEIASLCTLLDEDNSGTVSISEIIDFLCADVNVDSLEEQCSWASAALTKLKAAQLQSQADLRSKVAAWKIDAACSRVTPIKGMKLDALPSPGRPTTATVRANALTASPGRPITAANSKAVGGPPPKGSPRVPKAKAQPALPALTARGEESKDADANTAKSNPVLMNTLRTKIKAAASGAAQGRALDVIFGRFDKTGSGTLGPYEIEQAMRKTLRIPPTVISDDDISFFCNMLDTDKAGYVNISDLIAFLEQEPEAANKEKSLQGASAQKSTQKSQTNAPDESAGPAKR